MADGHIAKRIAGLQESESVKEQGFGSKRSVRLIKNLDCQGLTH